MVSKEIAISKEEDAEEVIEHVSNSQTTSSKDIENNKLEGDYVDEAAAFVNYLLRRFFQLQLHRQPRLLRSAMTQLWLQDLP